MQDIISLFCNLLQALFKTKVSLSEVLAFGGVLGPECNLIQSGLQCYARLYISRPSPVYFALCTLSEKLRLNNQKTKNEEKKKEGFISNVK